MVAIQNSDAIKAIRDGARLSISEGFPQLLGSVVSPVMDMTPDLHRKIEVIGQNDSGSTGTLTIYTTSAINDFYLCSISFSMSKDATCNATGTLSVQVTKNAVLKPIVGIALIAVTAQSDVLTLSFPYPILLDKSTAISLPVTFTLGAMTRTATIFGFEVVP